MLDAAGLPSQLSQTLARIAELEQMLGAPAAPRTAPGAPDFGQVLNQQQVALASPSAGLQSAITDAAQSQGLPPELVNAVVGVESGYNPQARSKAGALGLMQLMPGTAQGLGVTNPLDPVQNLAGGTRYLRQLIDRYDDVPKALGAYNAGPGAVDRHGGIPPYRETQAYVKKVMARWQAAGAELPTVLSDGGPE